MSSPNEFEQKVLSDLAQLKSQMRYLVGHGNSGRVRQMQDRLDAHEAVLNRAGGISAALAAITVIVHLGIDYLRMHRN